MKRLICICIIAAMMTLNCAMVLVHADGEAPEDYVFRTNAYDWDMPETPNWITDEAFFGQWSEEFGRWELEPYFNYDLFPAELDLENLAKEGNYALLKQLMSDYYKAQQEQKQSRMLEHPGETAVLVSELLARNFYAVSSMNGKPAGLVTVNSEWNEYTIDVLDCITSKAGMDVNKAFAFGCIDKSDSYIEIGTKESGHPATLTMLVNGATVEQACYIDSYISAAGNAGTNYGREQYILVQESGGYQDYNENIKRGFVTFDISDLSSSDEIEAAQLTVYARSVASTPVEKELYIHDWADASYTEDNLTWNSFTEQYWFSCNDQESWDYVTSNSTTIKGKVCFFHRGNEQLKVAQLYSYTGDEQYAYTFLRQVMQLNAHLGLEPNVMNNLDLAGYVRRIGQGFIQTWDSAYCTPDVFFAMLKQFYLITEYLVQNAYGRYTNNWGTYATLATYSMCAWYPELRIRDEWMEITREENDRLFSGFALEDGSCIEQALGYVQTLLGTFSSPIQTYRTTGAELPFNDGVMDVIYKTVKFYYYSMAPGYRGFSIGDGYESYTDKSSTLRTWYTLLYEDDPELEYVYTNGASGRLPEFTSISYPNGLRTYMRSDWSKDALALLLSAKNTGSHQHRDVNSITLFAYDRYLLTDQSYGAVQTGDLWEYMKSAPQHNVVTRMENGEQLDQSTGLDGWEKEIELNNLYDFASYGSGNTRGVSDNTRSVLFLRGQKFFIVSDYLRPEDMTAINTYAQNWHFDPSSHFVTDEETKQIRTQFDDVNLLVAPVDYASFADSYEEATLFAPAEGVFMNSRKQVFTKNARGEALYDTILVPENYGEHFSVTSERISVDGLDGWNAANCIKFRITDDRTGRYDDYYYYRLNDASLKTDVTIGRYETDADTLLVQEGSDGSVVSVFLTNGTYVKSTQLASEYLFKSTEEVAGLAFTAGGSAVQIEGETVTADALKNMTVYGGTAAQTAIFDGEFIDANTKGGYLYFGDAPLVDVPDEPDGPGGGNPGGGSGTGSGSTGNSHASASRGPGSAAAVVPPVESTIPEAIQKELAGHWAEEELTALWENGIINGDGGTLRLGDPISRSEFTTVVVRALGLDTEAAGYEPVFADVAQTDWFAPYVMAASKAGLVQGADGYFRPNDTITREELCKILIAAYETVQEEPVETADLPFTDSGMISDWAVPYVQKAVALGFMNGMEDGSFAPASNALREQAFAVIGRLCAQLQNTGGGQSAEEQPTQDAVQPQEQAEADDGMDSVVTEEEGLPDPEE